MESAQNLQNWNDQLKKYGDQAIHEDVEISLNKLGSVDREFIYEQERHGVHYEKFTLAAGKLERGQLLITPWNKEVYARTAEGKVVRALDYIARLEKANILQYRKLQSKRVSNYLRSLVTKIKNLFS